MSASVDPGPDEQLVAGVHSLIGGTLQFPWRTPARSGEIAEIVGIPA